MSLMVHSLNSTLASDQVAESLNDAECVKIHTVNILAVHRGQLRSNFKGQDQD